MALRAGEAGTRFGSLGVPELRELRQLRDENKTHRSTY